jgi:hypothetical protein
MDTISFIIKKIGRAMCKERVLKLVEEEKEDR